MTNNILILSIMTTKVKSSRKSSQVRKNEKVNAVVNAASDNVLLGVASSHDVRVVMDAGLGSVEDIDFIDNLLNSECDNTPIEDSKLYKKIVGAFSAPRFDSDGRISELMNIATSRGVAVTAKLIASINNKVSDEKRAFLKNNPAPAFSPSLVHAWIVENAASEFKTFTGSNINDIDINNISYHSRVFGSLFSSPLANNATLSEIVRAFLSEKTKNEILKVKQRQEWRDTVNVRKGAKRSAVAAYRSGSYNKDSFLSMMGKYWDRAVSEGTRLQASVNAASDKLEMAVRELFRISEGLPAFTQSSGYLEGVWYYPAILPKTGVPANVRKLWADVRNRKKDLERANELLRGCE